MFNRSGLYLNLRGAIYFALAQTSGNWNIYSIPTVDAGAFAFDSQAFLTWEDIPGNELRDGWMLFADILYIREWLQNQHPQNEESLAGLLLDEVNSTEFPVEESQAEWFDVPVPGDPDYLDPIVEGYQDREV